MAFIPYSEFKPSTFAKAFMRASSPSQSMQSMTRSRPEVSAVERQGRPLAQVLGSVRSRRSNRLSSLQHPQDTHRSLPERYEQSWTSPRAHPWVRFLDHIMKHITGSEEQTLPQTFLGGFGACSQGSSKRIYTIYIPTAGKTEQSGATSLFI